MDTSGCVEFDILFQVVTTVITTSTFTTSITTTTTTILETMKFFQSGFQSFRKCTTYECSLNVPTLLLLVLYSLLAKECQRLLLFGSQTSSKIHSFCTPVHFAQFHWRFRLSLDSRCNSVKENLHDFKHPSLSPRHRPE